MDVASIVAADDSNAAPRTPPRGDGADDGADENDGADDGDGDEMQDEDSAKMWRMSHHHLRKFEDGTVGRCWESGTGPKNLTLKLMLKFWALQL